MIAWPSALVGVTVEHRRARLLLERLDLFADEFVDAGQVVLGAIGMLEIQLSLPFDVPDAGSLLELSGVQSGANRGRFQRFLERSGRIWTNV